MYGPVRTVVWEGRSREAPPYPDCATAPRVTTPLGCGSRRLVWPKGSLSARQVRSEAIQSYQMTYIRPLVICTPLFLLNSASPGSARSRPGRGTRRSGPLTARTDLESSATRKRGFKSEGEGPLEKAPGGACADARGDTLLVELRPLLHIHPHPQNSKRLHLRFYLGRADHQERVK